MFGFLKDKLKDAVKKFSKDVDEEAEDVVEETKEEPTEEVVEETKEEQPEEKEEAPEEKEEEIQEPVEEPVEEEKEDETPEIVDEPAIEKKELEIEDEIKEEDVVEEPVEKEESAQEILDDVIEEEKETEEAEEKAEEQIEEELSEAGKDEELGTVIEEEKKGFFSKLKDKFTGKKEEDTEEPEEVLEDIEKEFEEEKKVEAEEKAEEKREEELADDIIEKEKAAILGKEEDQEEEKEKAEHKEEILEELEEGQAEELLEEVTEEIDAEKKDKPEEAEETVDEIIEEVEEEIQDEKAEESAAEDSGFFGKFKKSVVDAVTKKSISEDKFNDMFWDLEMVMLENNVAVEVIEKIKEDLKKELVETKIRRGNTLELIAETLKTSVESLFDIPNINLEEEVKKKKPYVIAFVGINGSGKTTTIGKLAHILKEKGISSCMAAADTFRAAAIQQLEEHANNVGVKIIKHDYGSDPAAVAFDTIKYAKSKGIDCVIVDTAGRLHSNTNLMAELKKIIRVSKPDHKIFVGESVTGNDCVEQAELFDDAVEIDSIFLTKADVDDKGGAAISISYVTNKPIIFLGTGQEYDDLKEFDDKVLLESIFGS